jgi:hypothetical protein
MTNHALVVIHDEKARQRVLDYIRGAALGSRVDIKGPKRTLPQNDRMWAMFSDRSKISCRRSTGATFSRLDILRQRQLRLKCQI